jgi:2-iminobutanoate/2-iminopropanoate deaminase
MKKIISTSDAPAAIGPYSQGVRVGTIIYYSGQIPLDPKTGQIVSGGVDVQARRVMENIGGLLKAEGLAYDNIVKTTIFLADINDFQAVNEIYGSYFKQAPPARSTIQAGALPKGARIEIEAIAMAGDGGSSGEVAADTSG